MNRPIQTDESALSTAQGDRLIRLFQDSFLDRPKPAVSDPSNSETHYWQPTLTDLTGRVVHALDPLLVRQNTPALPPTLHWLQPDTPVSGLPVPVLAPGSSSPPVSEQSPVTRPVAKPTL